MTSSIQPWSSYSKPFWVINKADNSLKGLKGDDNKRFGEISRYAVNFGPFTDLILTGAVINKDKSLV